MSGIKLTPCLKIRYSYHTNASGLLCISQNKSLFTLRNYITKSKFNSIENGNNLLRSVRFYARGETSCYGNVEFGRKSHAKEMRSNFPNAKNSINES